MFLQNEESDIPVVGGVASMKHEGLSINHKQRITKFNNILVVGYKRCATISTSEKNK